jgi:ribosome-associated translation inhibitor RaiA
MIELIAKQTDTKLFKVDTYLKQYNVTIKAALSVIFLVKKRQTDLDSNAVLTKTLNDKIHIEGDNIIITFDKQDFASDKLQTGERYVYGLGFKFTDTDTFLEPKIVDMDGLPANYLKVLPNYINQL